MDTLHIVSERDRTRFSLQNEDGSVAVCNLCGGITVNGVPLHTDLFSPFAPLSEGMWVQQAAEAPLCWTWELQERDGAVTITANIKNIGKTEITVKDWNVLETRGTGEKIFFSDRPERVRFFRWIGWDAGVETLASRGGNHTSSTLMHLYDHEKNRTLLIAFVTVTRMTETHHLTFEDGKITAYAATCGFGEHILAPGEELQSETLRVQLFEDPYAALDDWATGINQTYHPPIAQKPPVGWLGTFSDRAPREEVALENARLIRERLKGFRVEYIWTSQYNLEDYIPGNWEKPNRKEFPGGLPAFCEKLGAMGFRPGFWISPFWFYGEAEDTLRRCRNFLLKDQNGEPISEVGAWCFYYSDDDLKWYHMHKFFLDGSNPEALQYIENLFGKYREMGAAYYMLDFLAIKENAVLHRRDMLPMEAAREMLKAIRRAAGDDTHLQTAVASTPGFLDIVNAARVGRDFGEDRPLSDRLDGALSDWSNATRVLHDDHYANLKAFLGNMGANFFTHRKLYMNDGNVMSVDKPIPLEHARFTATVYGMFSDSPLMLGDDFTVLDEERLHLIKKCLPRARFSARPADLFETVEPDGQFRILSLHLCEKGDEYFLFAVFNPDQAPYHATLDFASLGLEAGAAYRVFEFWNQQYTGTYRRKMEVDIPPEACRLYRFSKVRAYPWLIGTDMHIVQGAVEIEQIRWDEAEKTLSGVVTRPVGEKGELYFLMSRKWEVTAPQQCTMMKDLDDMNIVIRMPIRFETERQPFSLSFKPWRHTHVVPDGYLPYVTEAEWLAYKEKNRAENDTRVYE